ncbi:MAG: precorrin-6A reductase [Lachnospiraceae bacterium]|nr:precorrin-6A reductase [Lachnospiraceae bacterium]
MYNILLFAGTTEGRTIAEQLKGTGNEVCVFVATEYGESLIDAGDGVTVESGRLTTEEMQARMEAAPDALVIDATHPYAAVVTENIRTACEETGHSYLRVLREGSKEQLSDAVYVESPKAAAEFLAGTEGNVLLTTGSKELHFFTAVPEYQERLFARVLSLPSVAASCAELGFQGQHLICMQGPFSAEMNRALIHMTDAKYLVTKDTGVTGGFPEKVEAAHACGVQLVIIGRPLKEEGVSVKEALRILGAAGEDGKHAAKDWREETPEENSGGPDAYERIGKGETAANVSQKEIALIGIGMGGEGCRTMTVEARSFCDRADLLIGAGRMVDAVAAPGQQVLKEYRYGVIAEAIENSDASVIAILLSGDVGFFSGAKKLLEVLPDQVQVMPGIGSLVYFCSQLHLPWEDIKITSNHGRISNMIGLCDTHKKVFSLLGKEQDVRELCRKFTDYGMTDLTIHVGEKFGYPQERILHGKPADFLEYSGDPLSVIVVENPSPRTVVTHGIPDEDFLRDKVPMTKEEIREISLSKLRLAKDSVIYDVGAGSGSVSVEMARMALEGQVYAIEKNPTAVQLLHENKRKFRTDNLEIIEGLAPEALKDLPVPTHAFIGGSSGNMKEILELLLEKNPAIRVVINTITLESIGEALQCVKELPFTDVDIAAVSTAKSKALGRYHLMFGQNPVYVVSGTGNPEEA